MQVSAGFDDWLSWNLIPVTVKLPLSGCYQKCMLCLVQLGVWDAVRKSIFFIIPFFLGKRLNLLCLSWFTYRVIYRYRCGRVDCNEEYIGESSRTFGERFREHQKTPSPIYDHSSNTGRQVTIDNFSLVGREDQNLSRTIKEALYIRVNNPSLNKNIGKYHLPHIWDEVLFNTSELKLK